MSSGYIDWILIDALAHREIIAYEVDVAVKLPMPGTLSWAIGKAFTSWIPLLFEAGMAGLSAWWLWSEYSTEAPHRWWWAGLIGVYYGGWVLTLPIRGGALVRGKRARQKELLATAERLKAMHDCYAELDVAVADPTRVRNVFLAAEKLGVRWSRATWPLFEAAIARHPHRWMTTR